MKFLLMLLAVIVSSHANANPKKFDVEGVYTADSTISHAPPRSTHALIEPDGDLWAADFYFTREAQSDFIITGEIDDRTGDGIALDYSANPPVPLSVKTTSTHHTARFLMTAYVEGTSRPPGSGYYNAPLPQYKAGPFDADLARLPRTRLELRTGSYTSISPYFAITFNKDEFTGFNGNCPFTGKVRDGEDRHYKRVTFTYTNACYLNPDSVVPFPVLKNSKLQGVIFASKRTESSWPPVETDVLVMIMRPKAGQYNLGFSRMFNR